MRKKQLNTQFFFQEKKIVKEERGAERHDKHLQINRFRRFLGKYSAPFKMVPLMPSSGHESKGHGHFLAGDAQRCLVLHFSHIKLGDKLESVPVFLKISHILPLYANQILKVFAH